MMRVIVLVLLLSAAWPGGAAPAQETGGTGLPLGNGDVNGSGDIDISDAVCLLTWLFLEVEGPAPIACPPRGGGPLAPTGQTNC